ncbi:MAG TPA: cysteine-rich CWC family protein [Xanthobacteraceae bacterium]
MAPARRVVCARCGAAFDCDPGGNCWCMRLDERLPMAGQGEDCVCADCLQAAARARPKDRASD